jgi:hypothetical protein
MNKTLAANLSLAFALALWPAVVVGYAPLFSAHEPMGMTILLMKVLVPLSFFFLTAAAWLAGFSFTEAKKRAVVSSISCVGYLGFIVWLMVWG